MKDEKKTKAQLIEELKELRRRNAELEKSETDQERIGEVLKESEEKFRMIFESVLDGILIAEVESKKFFMGNSSICRMLGYTEEEIRNLGVTDIHPPEDLPQVIDQFEKLARKEIEVAKDIPVKRKDGKIVYAEIVSTPMKLGEKLYLVGLFRDITERKGAEEALREQLHFLRQLIETMPIPIFYKDIHGLFRGCNAAFEKFVGLTKEQVLGQTVYGMYPKDLADIYDQADSGLFYHPGMQVYETSFLHADGSRHDVIFNKATYIDADGRVAGLIGAILDITEQKRAQETLQESEERFRRVFEEGPLAMCIAGPDFRLTKVNEAFCRMIGYTEQELAALTFKDITHPDHLAQDSESVKKLGFGEIPIYRTEKRYLRKDGETVWATATITAIRDLNGRALYFLSLIENITERKRGEEALRLSEEKFSKAFKISPDAVNINRLSDGLYLDINESFTQITGYTREDVIGRSSLPGDLGIWVRQEDRDKLVASLKATGEVIGLEAPFRRKNGTVLDGRMSARLLEISGELCILSITSDITERKRAEEALKESEERYRTAIEQSNDGVTLVKGDRHIYVNKKMLEIFGYEFPEEIVGKPVTLIVHPDDQERMKDINRRRQKGEAVPQKYEFKGQRKNGELIYIEVSASKTTYQGETVSLAYLRDITGRKESEEALRLNESRWSGLFELSQMASESELDLTDFALEKAIELTGSTIGYLAFLNADESVLTMFSWSKAAMRECAIENKPLEYPVETAGLWGEAVRQRRPIITNDYLADNPLKKGYPEGHVRVSRHMNIPLLDGGRIVLVAGVGNKKEPYGDEDVKQLTVLMDGLWKILKANRAEKALRESEDRFRMFTEKSPLGMSLIDADGRYEYINPAFKNIFGYDLSDIPTGQEWFRTAFPDPEYRREVMEVWQEDLIRYPQLETRPRSFEVRCKDGALRTILFRPITLSSGKQFVIYEDITERKQAEVEKRNLEEQLQRAEKMEALGTLAGGVAHDLNNVLGIIVGYAELLLYDIEGSSPLKPGLMNILGGSQKAAAIVQDLLTLARRGVATRKVINLNQIIVDYRNSPEFDNLISYHSSITIKADLEPDLLNISGSVVHLGKMLFNLVSNASEAMPKGGLLTIKTANQYLDRPIQGYDEVREGDYVVLSVSDTGEGIPAADLKRIFEPFYTKKVMGRSGTGLGLAVVWGTVKDHYGYINVQSEEGKGSTFSLYFPVTREAVTAEEVAISIFEYQGKGESILIVDDVKGQRDLAEEMLRKLNYEVKSVSSGEEAVAYLKRHKADLLVLDMIMDPGLDGLDTYKKILEIHPQQKAIIVSGFSESDRVHTAQALGAGAYVRKPYVLEKIGLAVRRELDK